MRTLLIAVAAALVRFQLAPTKSQCNFRQGRGQLPSLSQPRLHPNELTIPNAALWDAEITKMIKAYGDDRRYRCKGSPNT